MGRKTKYNGGIYSNKDKAKEIISAKQIEEKIGKQPLTTDEIAIYLTEYSQV